MFKTTQILLVFLICSSVFSSPLSSFLEEKEDNIHHISISNKDYIHPSGKPHKISLNEIVLLKVEQINGYSYIELVNHKGFTLDDKQIENFDNMNVHYYYLNPTKPGRYTLKIKKINSDNIEYVEYEIEVNA